MKIGLNAGHTLTGAGTGAVGVISESVETRRVAETLTPMLQSIGVEIIPCTIDKAASQSAYLKEAVQLANRQDLDWFVSIHFNNDTARKGQGVEVYTYKGRQYGDAVDVCRHIAALGFKNRGVKAGEGLYVIRKTKAKSMLIEVCFVNEPDAAQYQKMFNEICKAIAYALADYAVPGTGQKPPAPQPLPEKQKYIKVACRELTVRKSLAWEGNAAGTVRKNEVFTVAEGPFKVGTGTMYKLKSGLYITGASKYVEIYEK